MDNVSIHKSSGKVTVWLTRDYDTQYAALEAATRALQRELMRFKAEGKEFQSWQDQ